MPKIKDYDLNLVQIVADEDKKELNTRYAKMTPVLLNSKYWIIIFFLILANNVISQIPDSVRNWDNQLYLSNKVAGVAGNWRLSGELQIRLKDNWESLDRTFFEGVATYMVSKKIEIIPDFRLTVKPERVEYRPGLGIIYKFLKSDFQFVNQLKWQLDIYPNNFANNAMRYAVFLNQGIHEKIIVTFVGGALYKWTDDYNGFSFVRFGPGIAYVINKRQTVNFSYLLSATNNTQYWEWAGIPFVQLVININRHHKYVPAKYISF